MYVFILHFYLIHYSDGLGAIGIHIFSEEEGYVVGTLRTDLGTHKVSRLEENTGIGKLSCIKLKCLLCPDGDGGITIPLLHHGMMY